MKRLALVLFVVPVVALVAEEYPEFIDGMKEVDKAAAALRKMDKKTGAEAVSAAERIGGVYEEMIPFWRQRNKAGAVKLSAEGKAAAGELANAAHAGDAEKAEAAFAALGATCNSCHEERREKLADGRYKIK